MKASEKNIEMNRRKESMADSPTFKMSAGEEELLRILGRNGDIRKIRKYDISRVKKRMYFKERHGQLCSML